MIRIGQLPNSDQQILHSLLTGTGTYTGTNLYLYHLICQAVVQILSHHLAFHALGSGYPKTCHQSSMISSIQINLFTMGPRTFFVCSHLTSISLLSCRQVKWHPQWYYGAAFLATTSATS